MSRSRLIFVVFCITSLLIFTVYLRTSASRNFYNFRTVYVEQNGLKRQLWQKQLQLEKQLSLTEVNEQYERSSQDNADQTED